MNTKTKFMELYEKYHEKLIELRSMKGDLERATKDAVDADVRAEAHRRKVEAEITALLAQAQTQAKEMELKGNTQANEIRKGPEKRINDLKARIKVATAFLRKSEAKLEELRAQEAREVEDARSLYKEEVGQESSNEKMDEATEN